MLQVMDTHNRLFSQCNHTMGMLQSSTTQLGHG